MNGDERTPIGEPALRTDLLGKTEQPTGLDKEPAPMPEIPDSPMAAQVHAWAEPPGLAQDPDFRASPRDMAEDHALESVPEAPPRDDIAAAVRELTAPALADGTDPAAPGAAPVTDALAAHCAGLLGLPDGPGLRHRLAGLLARLLTRHLEPAADPRTEGYVRLLAAVDGRPVPGSPEPEGLAAALDWAVQALRTLRTDTLVLRPWRGGDAPAVAAAHRDPELRRWSTTTVNGEAEAHDWIRAQHEGWTTGTRHSFAVLEPGADGRLLGGAGLKHPAPSGPSAEVGYWTAPEARGRSVAPRAVTALTAWAFAAFATRAGSDTSQPSGLTRLDLLHQTGNTASCRVAHKCGYALDHVLPPFPPQYPEEGHVHVRRRDEVPQQLTQ